MKIGLNVLMVLIAVATATVSYVSFGPLDSSRNYAELPGDVIADGGSSVISGYNRTFFHFGEANFDATAAQGTVTLAALEGDDETSADEDSEREGGEDETKSGDEKKTWDPLWDDIQV